MTQTSAFHFESLVWDWPIAKKHATRNRANGELFYGRRGTLTHFSLQQAMCELEGGAGCALFPCGAAAVANSILAFVEQGRRFVRPAPANCTKFSSKVSVSSLTRGRRKCVSSPKTASAM